MTRLGQSTDSDTELAWRIVNSAAATCASANGVLVHRQLIGELREALQEKIPAEKASDE